jgi:putative nucleotidyltransferase with HDIG domain
MSIVPTYSEILELWKVYGLPEKKQQHSLLVAKLALFFASRLLQKKQISVQTNLLLAAALLHDIDKNISGNAGERHPDTGVRILKEVGLEEVARIVKTHPLHAILDETISPKSWEEKLLFLSDKMVKHDIITVEERFALWKAEPLAIDEQKVLDQSYQKVKLLAKEVLSAIGMTPEEVIKASKNSILSKEGELI